MAHAWAWDYWLNTMGLLEDILEMTVAWPDWLSDGLRRIFSSGEIKDQDLADIRAMLEQAEGAPVPVRLGASHIPSLGDGHTTVLLEMRDLQHVNRFALGSGMQFNAEGLNIVFGNNGTGKSGYSRVLKRACRARRSTPVLADAFDDSHGIPRATIVVWDEQNDPIPYNWQEGLVADDRLAMVAVYDSHCSADYISNEGACDYQPYGLPQLGELTQGMVRLQIKIKQEREAIRLDASAFTILKGDHDVGQAIGTLSANSNLKHFRQLGAFGEADETRIGEIDQLLATLDLEPKAKGADALALRLDQASVKCKSIESVASDRAVERLHELHLAILSAVEVDKVAQALLRGEENDDLEGTGSAAWKSLFKAAQSFSIAVYSHADHHPATDADARCVLCQQPLAPIAQDRLNRFRRYVASEAATALEDANSMLDSAVEMVANASTDVIDEATVVELRELDAATADLIEFNKKAWWARKQWTAAAYSSGNWWCPRPAPAPQPLLSMVLAEKSQACRGKAIEIRASKDEEQMRSLAKEKSALVAKRNLATLLDQIERFVLNAREVEHLESLENQLATKALSGRITTLSQKHITEALLQVMQDELSRLGHRSPMPVLKSRTEYGSNLMTLSLERTSKPPNAILSEGEQRAMGLALFLAEVRLRDDRSTLVFDDPSTSLDHRFRKRMAARLVELAQDRQVIVFTHDVVFLTQLRMAAVAATMDPKLQTVEWNSNRPGAVIAGLAWENEKFFGQFDRILKQATDLAEKCSEQLNDKERQAVRSLYSQLRGSLERGIREIVLFDVVHPFADQVKIENVGAVIGFSLDDWKAIVDLHDECSGVIAAHDTPSDSQQEIPHPLDLLERLKAILPVFEDCRARNSDFDKKILTPHRNKRNALRKG